MYDISPEEIEEIRAQVNRSSATVPAKTTLSVRVARLEEMVSKLEKCCSEHQLRLDDQDSCIDLINGEIGLSG